MEWHWLKHVCSYHFLNHLVRKSVRFHGWQKCELRHWVLFNICLFFDRIPFDVRRFHMTKIVMLFHVHPLRVRVTLCSGPGWLSCWLGGFSNDDSRMSTKSRPVRLGYLTYFPFVILQFHFHILSDVWESHLHARVVSTLSKMPLDLTWAMGRASSNRPSTARFSP